MTGAKTVSGIRRAFRGSALALRRARRLYVYLFCRQIRTHLQLQEAAERMQAYGLYAEGTAEKDVRFSILRKLWRISGHKDWHRWRERNGWSFVKWRRWDREVRWKEPPAPPRERVKIDVLYP